MQACRALCTFLAVCTGNNPVGSNLPPMAPAKTCPALAQVLLVAALMAVSLTCKAYIFACRTA